MRLGMSKVSLVLVSLAVAVLAAVGPARAAGPVATTVRVSFAEYPKALIYLRFTNNRLRVGRTLETLDAATPTRAKSGDIDAGGGFDFFQYYDFPEVSLPVSASGVETVTGEFNSTRYRSAPSRAGRKVREYLGVSGQVTLTKREGAALMGYVLQVGTGDSTSASPTKPLELKVPRLATDQLTFEVVTAVEGREARLGVQAKAGKQDLYNVIRDGKGIPAKLEVRDKTGRQVVSESGDLIKFGFT